MIGFTVLSGDNKNVIRIKSLYKRKERMTARLKAKKVTGSDGTAFYHFEIVWKRLENDCPKSKVIDSCVGKSFAPASFEPIDFAQLFLDVVGGIKAGNERIMHFNDEKLGLAVNKLGQKLFICMADFPQSGDFSKISKEDIWK